jgi:hypothetical protein
VNRLRATDVLVPAAIDAVAILELLMCARTAGVTAWSSRRARRCCWSGAALAPARVDHRGGGGVAADPVGRQARN